MFFFSEDVPFFMCLSDPTKYPMNPSSSSASSSYKKEYTCTDYSNSGHQYCCLYTLKYDFMHCNGSSSNWRKSEEIVLHIALRISTRRERGMGKHFVCMMYIRPFPRFPSFLYIFNLDCLALTPFLLDHILRLFSLPSSHSFPSRAQEKNLQDSLALLCTEFFFRNLLPFTV